jgi:DNA modification methylase
VVGNEHPTQKPLRLFEIPMEQHTRCGEVVLEPFSGSGSQLVAAERLRRRCRAMEISPAFVDVAVRRWEQATGKQAVLDGDGRTFAEIAAERAS